MKLKGVRLTVPLCDLRPLVESESRLSALDNPKFTKPHLTFVRHFGAARERVSRVRAWRPHDTFFISCRHLISLPTRLPDQAHVTHVVRRMYLDRKASVRFDFGVFTDPHHSGPASRGPLHKFARHFLLDLVSVRFGGGRITLPLSKAPPLISKAYLTHTSVGTPKKNLLQLGRPQVQVITECLESEIPPDAHALDSDERVFVSFASLPSLGDHDVAYIFYPPDFFARRKDKAFDQLREMRARIAWLHSDIEVLSILISILHKKKMIARSQVAQDYLCSLASGLVNAAHLDLGYRTVVLNLFEGTGTLQENRISRLLEQIHAADIAGQIRDDLTVALANLLGARKEISTNLDRRSREILRNKVESNRFDVFLSYNSRDRQRVASIASRLKDHGVRPWLDSEQLPPGRRLVEELETALSAVRVAAIFIGQEGLGAWQTLELDALLQRFVNRGCSLIPVILPEAPVDVAIPLFLRSSTWVDFREKWPDPLRRLLWGITGEAA